MKNIDLFNEILKYEEENENLYKERKKIKEKIEKNETSIIELENSLLALYNNEERTALAYKTLGEVKEILIKHGCDLYRKFQKEKDPAYKVLKNKYVFYDMITRDKKFIFNRGWKMVDNEYITAFPTKSPGSFADIYLDVYDINYRILFKEEY